MPFLNKLGDFVRKTAGVIKNTAKTIRETTDVAIEAALKAAVANAEEFLVKLRAKTRKNNIITILTDALMITVLAALYFLHLSTVINLAAVIAVNLVILGRLAWRVINFILITYKPNKELIKEALPQALQSAKQEHSLEAGIRSAIRAAFRYYYRTKIPQFARNVILPVTEMTGILKPIETIENDAVEKFYPLMRSYVFEAFVYNFVLFGVCYGAVIALIRQFLIASLI
jgi:amino acid transporter